MLRGWQKATIVPSTGIDESNDSIHQQPGSATDILNMQFDKGGKLVKRMGFSEISGYSLVSDAGYSVRDYNPKSLFSTGKELCLIDGQHLYARSESPAGWIDRGRCPIGTGSLERINTVAGDGSGACVARSSSYTVKVYATKTKDQDGVSSASYIYVTIESASGQVIHKNIQIATGASAATWVHSPKVIYLSSGKFLISYHLKCNVTTGLSIAGTLIFYTWDESTPATAPAFAFNYASGDALALYDNHWTYDMVPISSTDFALGYVSYAGNDVYLSTIIASSGATTAGPIAITTRTYYYAVAVQYDPIEEQIFLARAGASAGTYYLDWSAHTNPGLGVEYTNNNFLSETTSFDPLALGISNVAEIVNGDTVIAVGWSVIRSAGTDCTTRIRTAIASSGSLTGSLTQGMYGCSMICQPFITNKRCYVGLLSQSKDPLGGCAYLTDMCFGDDVVINAGMVGMWDMSAVPQRFETSVIFSNGTQVGACPHPSILNITLGYQDIVFVCPSIRDPFISTSTSFPAEFLVDWNMVTINTAAKIKGYRIAEGTAIIPGTMTAWYDGTDVFELGVCSTLDVTLTAAGGSPGLPAGTYNYKGFWQVQDAAGFIHRGPVSAATPITLGGVFDVDVTASTFAATGRNRTGPQQRAMLFRSSVSDSVFRRVGRPSTVVTNSWELNPSVMVWSDDDLADTGSPIYVEGGADLDAVAPAGCKGAAIVKDRVWLTGFYRSDRLQYSDPISPATVQSEKYAPEFNEAFSIMSPDGSEFTGVVDLLDRVLVFTSNKTYIIAGEPGDLAGQGSTLSGLQAISDKHGCINRDSIVKYPDGVFFLSSSGLCHVDQRLGVTSVQIVDTTVSDSGYTIVGSTVDEENQIVIFAFNDAATPVPESGLLLCYDYASKAFYKWNIIDSSGSEVIPIDITYHDGKVYVLDINGDIYASNNTDWNDESSYDQSWTSGWITPSGTKNTQFKLRYVSPIMRRQASDGTDVTVTIYYDYDDGDYDTFSLPWSDISTYGSSLIVDPRLHTSRSCRAFKVKIEAGLSPGNSTNGQGVEFMAIDFEWALKVATQKPTTAKRN